MRIFLHVCLLMRIGFELKIVDTLLVLTVINDGESSESFLVLLKVVGLRAVITVHYQAKGRC